MADPVPPGGGAVAADDSLAASVIRRYEERLARDPTSLAFAPLADAYRKAGRTREAIRLCRDGLGRFPHYSTARLILAKALLDEGASEDALGEVKTVLEKSPRDAEAHRLASEIYRRAGRLDDALGHLRQAVKLDPGDRESRALLEVLDGGGAVPEGSSLERLMADETFVTVSFGSACLEQGLVDEAAQVFLRLLKKDPGDVRARERFEDALRAKTQRRKGP
ncbi:MAG TPA: tetratricopeptide repeat protein [Methylomirabilota bacterium]|nr:tetratricopeptide repeat protein [Methylomirabilota bacterium]